MSLGSYLNLSRNPVSQIRTFLSRARQQEDQERLLIYDRSSLSAEDVSFEIIDEETDLDSQAAHSTYEAHEHPLGLSTLKLKYLKDKPEAAQQMLQKLKDKGFHCEFNFESRRINVRALEGRSKEQALQIIKDGVVEVELPIDGMPMMDKVDDGVDHMPTQGADNVGALVVKNRRSVTLVGLADAIARASMTIRQSVDRPDAGAAASAGDTREEIVQMTESCFTYLYKFKWAKIEAFVEGFPGVQFMPGKNMITLKGPSPGVDEVAKMIKNEVKSVKTFVIQLHPEILIATVGKVTETLGQKHQCSIIFQQSFGAPASATRPESASMDSQLYTLTLNVSGRKETRVKVVMNALEKEKAHVIVNTTNTELELNRGKGVSWCILQAAGPSIQIDVKNNHPDGIQHGEVAESGPGNITTCKTIYHGALPKFPKKASKCYKKQEDECFKWMVSLVFNCLIKASSSEKGYRTIAFPAFGTGFLDYPVQHVVQLMYKAIKLYNDDKRSGPIKTIYIVIYPDTKLKVKQLFLAHRHTHKMNTLHVGSTEQIHKEMRKDEHKKRNCEIRVLINNTLLQVVQGDIRLACDVTEAVLVLWSDEDILNPETNPGLKCTDPEKSNWKCASYVYELPTSKCTADSTNLPARTIIHSYCKDNSERAITDAVAEGLKNAAKIKCNTITIPIASDGHMGKTPQDSAQMIVNGIKRAKATINVATVACPDGDIFLLFAAKVASMFNNKLLEPADIDKSPVAVELWESTFASRAYESAASLEDVAAYCSEDAVLVVASESDEKNKMVAGEIKTWLSAKSSVTIQ